MGKRRMDRARVVLVVAFGASALLTFVAAWAIVTSPGEIDDVAPYRASGATPGDSVQVTVGEGEGPDAIGAELERLGVIESGEQFEVLVALMGFARVLQAGDYEFQRNTPALDVVYRIRNGATVTNSVTVIPGQRIGEIADAVEALGIPRDDFRAAASARDYDFDFVRELPEGATLEGYLYPATYPVRTTDTGRSLVQQMLQAFADNVPANVREQAAAQGLSLHEAVTLASIIQREAFLPEEKPVMAQVFLTRLTIGMRLDADPTVQYGLAEGAMAAPAEGWWKSPLSFDDLEFDSAYNTYLYFGLPPGPICSPTAETIIAAAQPSDTNYLYFVARPDGSHAFAETLEEHQANVDLYIGGGE